jgi:hypothetical protein
MRDCRRQDGRLDRRARTGGPETVTRSLSAYVAAPGAKSVTFYLDGRKLTTLTKPSDQRFSISVAARMLSYGVHRLRVAVTTDRSSCTNEATGTFIHAKGDSLAPTFAGYGYRTMPTAAYGQAS